jgi:hypothetical protein
MKETYSMSARGKVVSEKISDFLTQYYSNYPIISSVFGFAEASCLYGGRIYSSPQLSDADIEWLYANNINLKLCVSNMFVDEQIYFEERNFLKKHHREGNILVISNDDLAKWVRRDFPLYTLEASALKDIKTIEAFNSALEFYDTIVLPAIVNDDVEFLKSIKEKDRVVVFLTADCSYNCPAKDCYAQLSLRNQGLPSIQKPCSKTRIPRENLGLYKFDIEFFRNLGYYNFKVLIQYAK